MSLLSSGLKLNQAIIYGEGVREIDEVLARSGHGVAAAKLYSKSYHHRKDELPDIVQVCRSHEVLPYVGGGVTEQAIEDRNLPALTRELHAAGIDTVEVSNSDGRLTPMEFRAAVASLRGDFAQVWVEIGTKWGGERSYGLDAWKRDLDIALELKADQIILEGAGDGRCGIYHDDEGVKTLLVADLLARLQGDISRVLFEAPLKSHQSYWIKQGLGADVRLGNTELSISAQTGIIEQRLEMMTPERLRRVTVARRQLGELRACVAAYCTRTGSPMDSVVNAPELAQIPFGEEGIVPRIERTLGELNQ